MEGAVETPRVPCANRLTCLMLTSNSLEDLRGAINALFDVFVSIAEQPFAYSSNFTHADVLRQLQEVDAQKWSDIRARYLKDPLEEFCNGTFSNSNMSDSARILLDFIQLMDAFQQSMTEKLQEYQALISQLKDEKQTLERQYFDGEIKYRDERISHSMESMELKKVKCSILYYESVVLEKSNKIAELQRMNTVQLWEREKRRILEDANIQIDKLNTELAESRKSNEIAMKKIHTLEEHLKVTKLRQQRDLGERQDAGTGCDQLRRANYLLEKDLNFLEGELYKQQKNTVAAVLGIKTDVAILQEACRDSKTNETTDRDIKNLLRRVEFVYHAIKDGELHTRKAELLPHYLHLPRDVKLTKFKRLSSKPACPSKAVGESEDSSCNGNGHVLPYSLPSREHGPSVHPIRSAVEHWATVETKLDSLKTTVENPVIVNDNGTLMGMECLKHFPSMSKSFIQDHLNQFQEYDRNGDGTLDFQEVIKAINGMGVRFSATQAEEAMREVDTNGSRTLDFYEYLQVADKLFSKKGHAHLLRTGIAQTHNKIVAKTCVVQ
ncbi:uncharacterized protein LOC121376008 [Gigantopelta aegis]|uniref:uncharacterized protein LOC121376008 n=1 Tax=Gigantopelta aegis TaxID=1735272 RepID=UPI001B88B595|nr:uncharacterized protein LOC121376008 [Gigantopelta aegis]XP_041359709.1 uncharacterized protein LOC121376008 [Gigantopelta aegis]